MRLDPSKASAKLRKRPKPDPLVYGRSAAALPRCPVEWLERLTPEQVEAIKAMQSRGLCVWCHIDALAGDLSADRASLRSALDALVSERLAEAKAPRLGYYRLRYVFGS